MVRKNARILAPRPSRIIFQYRVIMLLVLGVLSLGILYHFSAFDSSVQLGPGPDVQKASLRIQQCADGIDNDGDGRVDSPKDCGCTSAGDNDESGNCPDVAPAELPEGGCIEVWTPEDLDNVRNNLAGHYCQMQDIDMSTFNRRFAPIGENPQNILIPLPFTGTYDGLGNKITNLHIQVTHLDQGRYYLGVGLFRLLEGSAKIENIVFTNPIVKAEGTVATMGLVAGTMSSGTQIANIIVKNGTLKGGSTGLSQRMGGIVGENIKGDVNSVQVEGELTSASMDSGGIIGYNEGLLKQARFKGVIRASEWGTRIGGAVGENYIGGRIIDVETECDVSMGEAIAGRIGGLVGINAGTIISDSSAKCKVRGAYKAGGLVGENYESTIERSFTEGTVSGVEWVGGFVGYNTGGRIIDSYSKTKIFMVDSPFGGTNYYGAGFAGISTVEGIIKRSYSIGSITNGRVSMGGFLASWYPFDEIGTIESSYWDVDTSGQTISAGGEGRTTSQMQTQSNYVGWDFDTVWRIDEGRDYPRLQWEQ